ncbi:MAG TPA: hypothetical protein VNE21_06205 [Mycobacteriales bacterium]|nr:hypothetical protein [Mycobacteriales bacterium]
MEGGTPISYEGVAKGTPMVTSRDREFGTIEHVLEIPQEDLFDGIVVKTADGLRFVDRDQISEITDRYVVCALTDEQVASLPKPSGSPVFHVDALQDVGSSLHDRFGRMFRRSHWVQDQD